MNVQGGGPVSTIGQGTQYGDGVAATDLRALWTRVQVVMRDTRQVSA